MDDGQTNYVGLLNEFSQRKGWTVQYDEVDTAGPDHMRQFTMRAVINNKAYPGGVGHNKKEAKRNAAKNAFNALKNDEPVTNTETSVNSSVSLPSVPQANFACWLNEYSHKNRTADMNYIGCLNNYCQTSKVVYDFKVVDRRGPAHIPEFVYKVVINRKEYPEGRGKTAKEAKQKAAELALRKLSDSGVSSQSSSPFSMSESPDDSSSQKSSTNQSDSESIIFANTSSVSEQQPLDVKPKRQLAPNFQNSPENKNKQSNFNALKMATPSAKSTPVSKQATKSRFLEEFDSIAKVGRGGFGHVYKARRKLEKKIFAVKIVKLKEKALDEVTVLSDLTHRNIVRYYSSWTEETQYRDGTSESYSSTSSGGGSQFLYIQMEFCEGENLREWIKKRNHNPEKYPDRRQDSENIIKQILEAVKCVHSKNLIHRDLKPENIMFGPEGCVKVGDFGLVTKDEDENDEGQLERTEVGTRSYMSPEQRQQNYDRKVDIYPVGLIFFELLWRFGTETEKGMQWDNIRSRIFPEGFSKKFDFEHKVIKRMLRDEAKRRPEASDLLRDLMQRSSNAASKEHDEQRKNRTY